MWHSCTDRGVAHKWGRNYTGKTSCWQCGVVGKRTDDGLVPLLCPECGGETNVADQRAVPPVPKRCAACMIGERRAAR